MRFDVLRLWLSNVWYGHLHHGWRCGRFGRSYGWVSTIEFEWSHDWLVSLPIPFEQIDLFADVGALAMKVEEDDVFCS